MTENNDAEHLRLLSVFHYVHAAIIAFYSLFALIYIVMGVLLAATSVAVSEQQFTAEATSTQAVDDPHATGGEGIASEESSAIVDGPIDSSNVDSDPGNSESPSSESRQRYVKHPRSSSVETMTIGIIFACIGGVVLLLGLTYALVNLLAGRFLAKKKHRTFCLIVSIVNCLSMPIGTVLGVFTLIVLMRPSVKLLYEGQETLAGQFGRGVKPAP